MAVKTAGMLNFERQLDKAFPHRKRPDGWIADDKHDISGHQPDDVPGSKAEWNGDPDKIPDVRAVDLALDLGDPRVSFQHLIDHLRTLPRLATVVRYMIYAGKIYHARAGFAPARYDGDDQHFGHGHVSFAWTEAADDNTTFDYRFKELTMPSAKEIAAEVWGFDLEDPVTHQRKNASAFQRYNDFVTAAAAQKVIDALKPELDELTEAIKILAAKVS